MRLSPRTVVATSASIDVLSTFNTTSEEYTRKYMLVSFFAVLNHRSWEVCIASSGLVMGEPVWGFDQVERFRSATVNGDRKTLSNRCCVLVETRLRQEITVKQRCPS